MKTNVYLCLRRKFNSKFCLSVLPPLLSTSTQKIHFKYFIDWLFLFDYQISTSWKISNQIIKDSVCHLHSKIWLSVTSEAKRYLWSFWKKKKLFLESSFQCYNDNLRKKKKLEMKFKNWKRRKTWTWLQSKQFIFFQQILKFSPLNIFKS